MIIRPTIAADAGMPAPSGESTAAVQSASVSVVYELSVPHAEDFSQWSTALCDLSTVPGIEILTDSEARALTGAGAGAHRCDLTADDDLDEVERPVPTHSSLVPANPKHPAASDVVPARRADRKVQSPTDPDGPLLGTAAMRQRPAGHVSTVTGAPR